MLTEAQVRTVVGTAVTAPSVHNSQPWRFAARGNVVEVRADRRRVLRDQDPDGRGLLVSCGAASLLAELAVRGLGRSCSTELVPDEDRPDVVARLVAGPPAAPTPEQVRLLEAVPRRHTDCGPYADWPVPLQLLDDLGRAAVAEGAWLQVLSPLDLLELALCQTRADAAVAADPAARCEGGRWAGAEAAPADGRPAGQVPGWTAGRREAGADCAAATSADDLVLVLGTPDDERRSWVCAGRALAHVLLTATSHGLVAAPATLALELPTVRQALPGALAPRGAPQVVLRAGFPAGLRSPGPGRRALDDVLVV